MEIFTNEMCEQNCWEYLSERETALTRLMKMGYEFNVGLGKIKTGCEINKSKMNLLTISELTEITNNLAEILPKNS